MAVVEKQSTQVTNIESEPRVLLPPNQESHLKCAAFDGVAIAATDDANSVYELCRLPKGARVVGITCQHSGLDGSTAATLHFGYRNKDGTTTGQDLDAFTVNGPLDVGTADGTSEVIADPANANVEVPIDAYLIAQIAAETSLAAGNIAGNVRYMVGEG